MLTRRGFLKFVLKGALLAAVVAGYPLAEAMASPRVTRYKFTPPNWTPGLKLKVALIADVHACEPWMSVERITGICDQANSLDADLILLLGDYVSGMNLVTDNVHSSEWSKAMARLKAPLGVHAILGNHDHWEDLNFQRDPTIPTIAQKALEAVGIPVYVNNALRLEKDGYPFWLAGLGDQVALRPGKRFNRASWKGIDELRSTLGLISDSAPVILMAHEPDIFPRVPNRVSLTVSGHTHGGQVNLFGWKPVVPSHYGARYAGGHIEEGGRHLVVSRGLGCSMIPVRFMVRPELVLMELA